MKAQAYFTLIRLHKPIGIYLLWWPTAWALWISNAGHPPLTHIILFFLGCLIMRSAGCVLNDIADRNIDCHVKRTQTRPLALGEVSLIQAWGLCGFLLLIALIILLNLPKACFYPALAALFLTGLYPFCKRYIKSPQLILGLAFSMGIPMVFIAANHSLDKLMLGIWLINVLWVMAYDTEYAMADREDDIKIGVKSTAILFASYDRLMIGILQACLHLLWLLLPWKKSALFWCCWLIALFILGFQHVLLRTRKSNDCLRAFNVNQWYGLIMWCALLYP